MKKICISFVILFILLTFSILVEAATQNGTVVNVYGSNPQINYEVENKKREEATQDVLSTLLEKYKTEEVPEEERILEYRWNGYGVREMEDETKEFKCTINFEVKPYLEENSNWDKSRQMCFAEFDRIDGELVLRNISLTPENYDEFITAFEEYEKNEETIVELTGTLPEESMNLENEDEIDKLSNFIFVGSAIVLGIVILVVVIIKIRNKK